MPLIAATQAKLFCERILGNLSRHSTAGKVLDEVDIRWDECGLRALRKPARSGREIVILLPIRAHLGHGDILLEDNATLVVVNVIPCEVLVCRTPTPADMGHIALELGNLHIPAQIDGCEIITPDDPEARAAFLCCGLTCEQTVRRFEPTRRLMPLIRLAKDFRVIRRRAI